MDRVRRCTPTGRGSDGRRSSGCDPHRIGRSSTADSCRSQVKGGIGREREAWHGKIGGWRQAAEILGVSAGGGRGGKRRRPVACQNDHGSQAGRRVARGLIGRLHGHPRRSRRKDELDRGHGECPATRRGSKSDAQPALGVWVPHDHRRASGHSGRRAEGRCATARWTLTGPYSQGPACACTRRTSRWQCLQRCPGQARSSQNRSAGR